MKYLKVLVAAVFMAVTTQSSAIALTLDDVENTGGAPVVTFEYETVTRHIPKKTISRTMVPIYYSGIPILIPRNSSTEVKEKRITVVHRKVIFHPNMPPDPAAAGLTDVEGFDDGDGVRDDVERYIALTYHNDPNARLTLYEVAEKIQSFLEETYTSTNLNSMQQQYDCLQDHFGTGWLEHVRKLHGVIYNTGLRVKEKYLKLANAHGQIRSVNSCPN